MRNSRYGPTPVVSRSLLIPADVYERLREYAEANRISIAQVMNEALRRYADEVIGRQTNRQTE